jgi:hypothetical protein
VAILSARCCGLDLHKRTVVAGLFATGAEGKPTREIQPLGTMTSDLLALSDWLAARGDTPVAMASTGGFWKPSYNLLEDLFTVWVINARHIKAATTDSPQWKHGGLDRHGRGDRSDPCIVRPAVAVA